MNPLFLTAVAFAQSTPAATTPPAGGPAQQPGLFPPQMLIMMGVLFFLFYFLILRPQKAEQRRREELLNSIAKGDQVLTSGGIMGTVESVDANKATVVLTIAPKVSVKFARAAISSVTKKKDIKESEGEANA